MLHLDLPPLLVFGEAVDDFTLHEEFLNVTTSFCLTQRYYDIPAVSVLVSVDYYSGRTAVILKELSFSPRVVLKSNDEVLEKLDSLAFIEKSNRALRINKLND
jgi:hypothetical protein